MNTGIIVAIVALVSTMLGATIGAATNYVLAVRRERADTERDNRDHAIEVKRAARLLDRELLLAQSLADILIDKRYWVQDAELSTEAWQKYGGTIAPDLSNEAWHAITIAFVAVEHIKGSRALYLSSVLRDRPISDGHADGVAPMLRDVTLGREALAPFGRGPDPREDAGLLAGRAPAIAMAYIDMKQHADYVTAEARRLSDEVKEVTARQQGLSTDYTPARRPLHETIGLSVATNLFWQHVGKLLFPSQPHSPEITEKTLMAVREAFIKAHEQVNAETKRRVDSAQGIIKSIESESQKPA
jgi:hypothetical protein